MLFYTLSHLVQLDCYSQGMIHVLEKFRPISLPDTASAIGAVAAAFSGLVLQGCKTGTRWESEQGN